MWRSNNIVFMFRAKINREEYPKIWIWYNIIRRDKFEIQEVDIWQLQYIKSKEKKKI
jgi:hypothetical protein